MTTDDVAGGVTCHGFLGFTAHPSRLLDEDTFQTFWASHSATAFWVKTLANHTQSNV